MTFIKIGTHILGSISFAAMQWIILVFISKYLGIESAGAFSYYLAIFAPLAILCAMNLKTVYSADTSKKFSLDEYEIVRSYFIICYLLIGVVILSMSKDYLFIGFIIFFVKFIEVCAELIYGKWVREGSPHYFGYSKLIKLTLFLTLSFLIITSKYEGYIYIIYPLAFLLGYCLFDKRFSSIKFKLNFKLKKIKPIFYSILPFVLTSFIISLNTSIPRFFIDFYYNKEMVAEFMFLIYFITIMLLPLSSLFQAILPKIKNKNNTVLMLTLTYVILYSLLFYFFCDEVLQYFYNYEKNIPIKVKALVISMMIFQSLIVYINMLYVSSMMFKKIFYVTIFNTIILILANYNLIKIYGYEGVYYAGALSSLVLFLNLFFNYLKEKRDVL